MSKLKEAEATILRLSPGDLLFIELPEDLSEPELRDFQTDVEQMLDNAKLKQVSVMAHVGRIKLQVVRAPTGGDHAVVISPVVVRATRVHDSGELGRSLVRDTITEIRLIPVIEEGKKFRSEIGYGKNPDTCVGFKLEIALWPKQVPFAVGGDSELEKLLLGGRCALELWTKNIVGSSQDPTHPWTHFLFTDTLWESIGPSAFLGRALMTDVPVGLGEDVPEGEPPTIGWWKTSEDPPRP